MCRDHGKKSKARKILECVLKSLKAFLQDDEKYKIYESTWTAAMESLEQCNSIADALPWVPLLTRNAATPSAAESTLSRPTSRQNTEQHIREIIPQAIHSQWSKKDRDRANEVRVVNSATFDKNC